MQVRDLSNNELCYVDEFKRINKHIFFKSITLSEYIFYTTEGFTQDPECDNVENCQVIGRALGENEDEAKKNLLKENPWIEDEHGFDKEMFISKELAPCKNADKKLSFLTGLLDESQLNSYTTWLKSVE